MQFGQFLFTNHHTAKHTVGDAICSVTNTGLPLGKLRHIANWTYDRVYLTSKDVSINVLNILKHYSTIK